MDIVNFQEELKKAFALHQIRRQFAFTDEDNRDLDNKLEAIAEKMGMSLPRLIRKIQSKRVGKIEENGRKGQDLEDFVPITLERRYCTNPHCRYHYCISQKNKPRLKICSRCGSETVSVISH